MQVINYTYLLLFFQNQAQNLQKKTWLQRSSSQFLFLSLSLSPFLLVIIVSIDEHSESQYVNKIFSKNSIIDYTARIRGFQNKSKGKQETEKQKDRTVWG